MIEAKQIAGIMNLDDPEEIIPSVHHANARNIKFRGTAPHMRIENIPGTTLIPNSDLPTGTNLCIGHHYDQVKGRLIYYNYNSNGNHGIYFYQLSTGTIQRIVKSNSGTSGDILAFDLITPIIHVGIIYGDNVQGDILYFLNCQGQPCKINIDRALSGGYGTIQRSYLDVAKEPPSIPPIVSYEDDPTVTVNNMRKKLFVFKSREWFDDNDKSTWGEHSELPLPLNPFDNANDADPTKNADIAIVVQTGKPNVKKIEIAAAVSIGNGFSDFFTIAVLNKTELNIQSNDIYLFRFYNDKQYNYVETNTNPLINESILLFDLVPQAAQSQEILNGNTLIYANVTEGYPNLTQFSNGTNTTNVASGKIEVNRTNKFFLFIATQGGETANGSGVVHMIVAGKISQADFFAAYFGGTTVSYSAGVGESPVNVINGLAASATSNGFSVISSDNNNLFIQRTTTVLDRYNSIQSSTLVTDSSSYAVYDWWSNYDFAIEYDDDKMRTNGMDTNIQMAVQSNKYEELSFVVQLPKFTLNIYHRPPIWAKTFRIGRTKNLSKSKLTQWISDRTIKDGSPSSSGVQYAYISIENLNTFVKNNPGSPLTYQFSANDRIRFIKLFNATLVNPVYTDKDFEIQGQLLNPIINGVQQTGQFIKIILPVTSSTFDFGTTGFNNYFIELYSPAQPVANGLDAYFEFGERYAIINPGSGSQYHQGQTQNQTSNLGTPATFTLTKGDDYFRPRKVNTGVEIIYAITAGEGPDVNAGRVTLGMAPTSISYNDPNIQTGTSAYNNLTSWSFSNPSRLVLKVISGNYTFRIQGTLQVTFDADRSGDTYQFLFAKNDGTGIALTPVFDNSKANTYTFTVDATFILTAGQFITPLGFSFPDFDHTRSMAGTNLTITSQQFFSQGMIDPNFSDYYASAVNSNGRELIHDPNAATVTFPTLLRWGQSYLVDTNINQSNRFYSTDFDTLDRGKGAIKKLKVRDRILRGWQERYCFQMGIYAKFIQDSSGQNTLTTTDSIITSNNVQYYEGEYGVYNHPESIVHGKIQDYFIDPIRGYQCRLSNDGIIPISELYKGQYTIRNLITPYSKNMLRADGSTTKILGCYDYFEEEYICYLQASTSLEANVFGFNEKRNAYSCFYDYVPDWIASAEDKKFVWLFGNLYSLDNEAQQNTFFGATYPASIDLVFNDKEPLKKTFNAVAFQSNRIWGSYNNNDIITSMINPQTGFQQSSKLIDVDYEIMDNIRYAAFLRDQTSMLNGQLALVEGDFLNGQWIKVRFQYGGSDFSWFFAPYINYQPNPRNF